MVEFSNREWGDLPHELKVCIHFAKHDEDYLVLSHTVNELCVGIITLPENTGYLFVMYEDGFSIKRDPETGKYRDERYLPVKHLKTEDDLKLFMNEKISNWISIRGGNFDPSEIDEAYKASQLINEVSPRQEKSLSDPKFISIPEILFHYRQFLKEKK